MKQTSIAISLLTCRTCGVPLEQNNWYPSSQKHHDKQCTTCITNRVREWRKKPRTLRDQQHCHVCNTLLTDENWYPSRRKEKRYICKGCYKLKNQKNWQLFVERNPNFVPDYWRKMKNERPLVYRERRAKTGASRRKILTQFILNLPFTDSHLHHLGAGLAIYIPSDLHKSIPHCLKTGLNMAQINEVAIQFFSP